MTTIHSGFLALESSTYAALVCGTISLLYFFAWWKRIRLASVPVGASAWFGMTIYWILIAASAGPSPVFSRDQLGIVLRITLFVTVSLFLAWSTLWFRWLVSTRP